MSKRFFSKGKGGARKVIPLTKGWGKKKRLALAPFDWWKGVPGAVRIMDALENAYAVVLDQEDLLEMDVHGIFKEDIEKIPELEEIKKQLNATTTALKDKVVPALNDVIGLIRYSRKMTGGLGVAIQNLEAQFWAAMHDAFAAQEGIEKIMKKRNDSTVTTSEGYSLASMSADINDATTEIESAMKRVKRTFIETRKEDYQKVKERRKEWMQDGKLTVAVTFNPP